MQFTAEPCDVEKNLISIMFWANLLVITVDDPYFLY